MLVEVLITLAGVGLIFQGRRVFVRRKERVAGVSLLSVGVLLLGFGVLAIVSPFL